MGLLSFTFAGVGFILIGSLEALTATSQIKKKNPSPLFITLSIFSSFFILNSAASLFDAHKSNDAIGTALQLQVLAIAFLFLLHSLLSLLSLPLPSQLLSLVTAFGFAEEFLLFYLQRKDPTGVENRYYDLLLVPIAVCVFSTLMELLTSEEEDLRVPKLGRGIGLILQGTWFIQMGVSLFSSNWGVAEGCSLHSVSRGNYTLRCKGHPQYHRARAIATLQFNCHLALMVVLVVAVYSLICAKNGGAPTPSASSKYTPLGAELKPFQNSANFTLDSDDEEEEIKPIGINGTAANSPHH